MRIATLPAWVSSIETRCEHRWGPVSRILTIEAGGGPASERTRIEIVVPDTFEWRELRDRRLRVIVETDDEDSTT